MLTTAPTAANEAPATCPVTSKTVYVPLGSIEGEWQVCQACRGAGWKQTVHRVRFLNGDKRRPVLRVI